MRFAIVTALAASILVLGIYGNTETDQPTAEVSGEAPVVSQDAATPTPDEAQQTEPKDPLKCADKSGTLILDQDNFEANIKHYKAVLVKFYAPWCGFCKKLAPKYKKGAKYLRRAKMDNVKIAKIDVVDKKNDAIGKKYKIDAFPTLMWFINGDLENPVEFEDYDFYKVGKEIVEHAKKYTADDLVTKIGDVETLNKFKEEHGTVLLGFMSESATMGAMFQQLLNGVAPASPVKVAHVTNDELAASLEYKSGDVVLVKKDEPAVMWDPAVEKELSAFIKKSSTPLVYDHDDHKHDAFADPVKTHLMLFYSKSKTENAEQLVGTLKELAPKYKGQLVAVHVNTDSPDAKHVLTFSKLEKKDTPCVSIMKYPEDSDNVVVYKQPGTDLSVEGIESFATGVLDGSIKEAVDDASANVDSSSVVNVDKNSWKELVADSEKAVFLKIYANWCQHCKRLIPVWAKLSEMFKGDETLSVLNMDGDTNEIKGMLVDQFPTIMYKPNGKGAKLVEYNGYHELEVLVKFLKKNGKKASKAKPSEGKQARDEL